MRLHDPWLLLVLLFIPLVFWLQHRRKNEAAVRYSSLALVRSLTHTGKRHWGWILPVFRGTALFLLVLALARPQLGTAQSQYYGEGIAIVLAVDISSSMLSEDFSLADGRANRLEVVKSVVRDFMATRRGDRVGLVLFSARPYTQCPLTLDHGWLLHNLERAEIGMIEDGTAIGSALATAAGRLEHADADSKIVILLTDGQNNAGRISPLTAADAATALGIKVYTIGAGTRGMAPYPTRDMFGNTVYRPLRVDLDEETLSKIAQTTGGRYFRATDTASLQAVYETIDQLERTTFQAPHYLDYYEFYPWCILGALALVGLETGLSHTILRKLP